MLYNPEDLPSWEHFVVYLCGPMDFAKDLGIGWRDEITNKLLDIGIQEKNILNPCKKPAIFGGRNLSDEQRLCNEFRAKKDWVGLSKLMKKIMAVDLRMCDKADLIIANFSHCDRTTGSIHEIVSARNSHKPVFLIDEKGFKNVSGWLFGLLGPNRIFESVDDAVDVLRRIIERGPVLEQDMKDFMIFDFDKKDYDVN